ncbi:uncharacterized protein LOC112575608 [Pomacea canaliculata]|uniref:uncharacterized protein LOC112575608 n=1 Tax=Pomacea canaliculata TaxID=400727 RepID=UPI000D72716A|nr:uncharacterized protein LOC112575608 [Pomacea canaliculata]XP_025113369.1 uncharacterized protein LOC112575608 [Pomacea canaliculata]
MSGHQPSAPRKGQRPKGRGGKQHSTGRSRVEVYLHTVTDQQAELLADTANTRPLEEVKKKSGADVNFDPNPSPVPGMKVLIIRGDASQIKAAVSLINQKTGSKILWSGDNSDCAMYKSSTCECQDPGSGRVVDRTVLHCCHHTLPGATSPATHGASKTLSHRTTRYR